MTEFGDVMLQRIAEALEKLNEKLIPIIAKSIVQSFKAEEGEEHSNEMTDTDEKPLEVNDLFKGDEAKNVSKPLPKEIDYARIYNYMRKDGKTPNTCNKCSGFISWDLRPERIYPLHVNQEGKIVDDGNCPEFGG